MESKLKGPRGEPVAGVILAAGRSSRIGRPKALLPLPGGTVISRLIGAFRAAGIAPIHVVVGYRGRETAAALAAHDDTACVRIVWNDLHPLGQTTSLQAGIRSLPTGVAAALLSPVDYPLVTAGTITLLLHAFRSDRAGTIFLPACRGRRGHPFLVSTARFPDFLDLAPGEPGRDVVHARPDEVRIVDVDSDSIHVDIDEPADYRSVRAALRRT